jgi:hypothetical protein
MNFKSGLFRLWAVSTAAWFGFMVFVLVHDHIDGQVAPPIWEAAMGILGPPVVIFALGAGLMWVVSGFKRQTEKTPTA